MVSWGGFCTTRPPTSETFQADPRVPAASQIDGRDAFQSRKKNVMKTKFTVCVDPSRGRTPAYEMEIGEIGKVLAGPCAAGQAGCLLLRCHSGLVSLCDPRDDWLVAKNWPPGFAVEALPPGTRIELRVVDSQEP